MSNDIIASSGALGEPIELYRFSYGVGAGTINLAYCDSDFEVTAAGVQYQPAYLERTPINASGNLDKSELEVSVAEDSAIAQLFSGYPPGDIVGLTIFLCHYDADTDDVTTPEAIWIGRVLVCSREGFVAKLRCEPVATSMRRVGLRRHYQYMCPHVLYGAECKAIKADHTSAFTAAAVGPRTVAIAGDLGQQYAGGVVAWTPTGQSTQQRTVLRVDYDAGTGRTTLTLAGAPTGLTAGNSVDLALGCRHNLTDCVDVFDNAPHFGGMPYIPTKNPHGTTAIYN